MTRTHTILEVPQLVLDEIRKKLQAIDKECNHGTYYEDHYMSKHGGMDVWDSKGEVVLKALSPNLTTTQIPVDEHDNVLHVLWMLLVIVEGQTKPEENAVDALLVEQTYEMLNRLGVTSEFPRWKSKATELHKLHKTGRGSSSINESVAKDLEGNDGSGEFGGE